MTRTAGAPGQPLLSAVENEAAYKFMVAHRCKRGAGRKLILTAQSTGVGTRIIVACSVCNKSKDISDYDHW